MGNIVVQSPQSSVHIFLSHVCVACSEFKAEVTTPAPKLVQTTRPLPKNLDQPPHWSTMAQVVACSECDHSGFTTLLCPFVVWPQTALTCTCILIDSLNSGDLAFDL